MGLLDSVLGQVLGGALPQQPQGGALGGLDGLGGGGLAGALGNQDELLSSLSGLLHKG